MLTDAYLPHKNVTQKTSPPQENSRPFRLYG